MFGIRAATLVPLIPVAKRWQAWVASEKLVLGGKNPACEVMLVEFSAPLLKAILARFKASSKPEIQDYYTQVMSKKDEGVGSYPALPILAKSTFEVAWAKMLSSLSWEERESKRRTSRNLS